MPPVNSWTTYVGSVRWIPPWTWLSPTRRDRRVLWAWRGRLVWVTRTTWPAWWRRLLAAVVGTAALALAGAGGGWALLLGPLGTETLLFLFTGRLSRWPLGPRDRVAVTGLSIRPPDDDRPGDDWPGGDPSGDREPRRPIPPHSNDAMALPLPTE